MAGERRKRRTDKSSPPTDPDPPLPSVPKRHKHTSNPSRSTQPRQVENVTASLETLSVKAPVHPQGGTVPHDQYGLPLAGPIPGQYPPYPSNYPEQPGTYQSAQYGHSGIYPSVQPGQYPTYQSNQTGQYPTYQSNLPEPPSAYSSVQPGQQQSRHWKDKEDKKLDKLKGQYDKKREKWSHIAQAMTGKFGKNFTRNECKTRWDSAEFKAKLEFFAANPESSDSSSEDEPWSRDEDEQLVYLKGQYDHKDNEWELIAQGLYNAGFTDRTKSDCDKRWTNKLAAKTKIPKPEEWSKEEDKRLTKLVKDFQNWNADKPWESWDLISEQMSMFGFRRAAENCRTHWRDNLRGAANYGEWAKVEEDLLLECYEQYKIEEIVDLLERRLHSIRTVDFCGDKLRRLAEASSGWSKEQDDELIKAMRESPFTLTGEKLLDHITQVVNHNTGSSRDPGDYERRWREIGPQEDQGSKWSKEEFKKLDKLAKQTARDWKEVSKLMAEGTHKYNRSWRVCRAQWNKKFGSQ